MKSSIYLHIPFCRRKCDYCNFYSISPKRDNIISCYVDRLIEEIQFRSNGGYKLPVDTIYFGGGTPSLLDVSYFEKILKAIDIAFDINPNSEITVEMNPQDLNKQKLLDLNNLGVNRIVLGVQTFDQRMHNLLGRKGRLCTPADLDLFFSTGNFIRCIDIIAGMPSQTEKNILSDLKETVLRLPEHISLYLLSIEDGTPLAQRVFPNEAFEDNQRNRWENAMDFLFSKGYEHYEISNFCRPGFEARHNMKYWSFAPYLGFGAGAHSFFNGKRFWSKPSVDNYIQSSSFSYIYDDRGENAIIVEFLMTSLRLIRGFTVSQFRSVTGMDIPPILFSCIKDLIARDMMAMKGDRIFFTHQGLFYSDSLIYNITESFL